MAVTNFFDKKLLTATQTTLIRRTYFRFCGNGRADFTHDLIKKEVVVRVLFFQLQIRAPLVFYTIRNYR